LGISQTGEMLTAPLWGNYMRDIHNGLPQKSFSRPSGVVDVAVCRGSGLLMTDSCTQGAVYLPFLEGTVPSRYCDIHGGADTMPGSRLPSTTAPINNVLDSSILDEIPRPKLQLDLFPELQSPPQSQSPTQPQQRQNQNQIQNNRMPSRNTPPVNNSRNNQRNNQTTIPDTAVIFDPTKETAEEKEDEDDDYLPAWDQVD